jgi:hypothetical protein
MIMSSPLSPVIANFFMEELEEMVLNRAAHKPLSWFHYMDVTFVIGHMDPTRLREFLVHMKSVHQNIQLSMTIEIYIHLPYLDTDTYRRPNGSLGCKLYSSIAYSADVFFVLISTCCKIYQMGDIVFMSGISKIA